jgi:hypothetical protein
LLRRRADAAHELPLLRNALAQHNSLMLELVPVPLLLGDL